MEQLTNFLTEIQKCDGLFEVFQVVTSVINRTYPIIRHEQKVQGNTKFQQKKCRSHSFRRNSRFSNHSDEDEDIIPES